MTSNRTSINNEAPNFLTMSLDVVTVRVGDPDVTVNIPVYCEILSAVSPYFRGAFEGSFKEATERTIPLSDVSEQTFRIFLQWMHTQASQQSTDAFVPDLGVLLPPQSDSDPSLVSPLYNKLKAVAFDDRDSFPEPEWSELNDKLYYENPEWITKHRCTMISYLRLYIFADRYNVPQLRDDIMTACVGQAHAWNWWPGPDKEFIAFAFDNLPKSSKFLRFLVLSAAFSWLSTEDCSINLRALMDMHPDFAFEVNLAQTKRLHNHAAGEGGIPLEFDDCIANSCVFHEHLVHDVEQCRLRILNKAHVFAALVNACIKDGLTMSSGQAENA